MELSSAISEDCCHRLDSGKDGGKEEWGKVRGGGDRDHTSASLAFAETGMLNCAARHCWQRALSS